jgi:hypothetical protein
MTLIFDARRAPTGPQTHALVIGVSDYPHLLGGTKWETEPARRGFGMEQVPSTVASATAFADWVLTRHRNPFAPLGTLRLLLSPGAYAPTRQAADKLRIGSDNAVPVAEPVLSEIKAATEDWFQIVNTHPDNIALFFFAGHGLEADDRYLLPADYGSDPDSPYDKLINITATHNNMRACKAQTQCFFIDACRDRPAEFRLDVLDAKGTIGHALVSFQGNDVTKRDAPIYHAAIRGNLARGPAGQVSYFTYALLECLNGSGAYQMIGNDLPIDQDSLGKALRELTNRLSPYVSLGCDVAGEMNLQTSADLHLASPPIKVLATLRCHPGAAHAIAGLACIDAAGERHSRSTPGRDPWRFTMQGGLCHIEVKFSTNDPWLDARLPLLAGPPIFKPPILVTPKP